MGISTGLRQHGITRRVDDLIGPCIRQLLVRDRVRPAERKSRIEMHEYFHDTIAIMDRLEVGDHHLVRVIILALITDSCAIGAGVHVTDDRIFRCRPCGEGQGEDRIDIIRACRINGIYIYTATPYILAAPNDGVALTGREFLSVLVGLRSSRNDRHRDLIRAVAPVDGLAVVIICAVGRDVLSVPVKYRSLR